MWCELGTCRGGIDLRPPAPKGATLHQREPPNQAAFCRPPFGGARVAVGVFVLTLDAVRMLTLIAWTLVCMTLAHVTLDA